MNQIQYASELIKNGEIVSFPTETVYGLGADATNEDACFKIFSLKKRPNYNPLIIHVASIEHAQEFVIFNEEAFKLAKFWPGPLSMVLPRKKACKLTDCVSGGLNTIAIRIPANKIALKLIKKSGVPIAAPSANISGRLSPTRSEHVKENFGNKIFILENDEHCYGLESTIIDLSCKARLLRHGFITQNDIESCLHNKIEISHKDSKIKAPGMLLKHYSPETKIRINATSLRAEEIGLDFGASNLKGDMNLSHSGELIEAGYNLFDYLHIIDRLAISKGINTIAVASIPNISVGIAINDRLIRASNTY